MTAFKPILVLTILVMFLSGLHAQETFPRNDVKDTRSEAFALTHATIQVNPGSQVQDATLLIKGGKIIATGKNIDIPPGFQIIDLKGSFVYPSFIDPHTNYGLPEVERPRGGGFGGREQITSNTKGAYNANESIKSHYHASSEFSIDNKEAGSLRAQGFGAVLTFRPDGLARGTSTFVSLGEESDNIAMLKDIAAAHYSLNRGTSRQNYPRSMMGYISLHRQTFLDAAWYGVQSPRPFADKTLEAWIDQQYLPQIFDAGSWINALRADKIGDEFGVRYIVKGGGDAYQRIDEVKAANVDLIVPVNFPDAHDVDDPLDAEKVSLEDMKHWELAPANAAAIHKAGIRFAFTADGLRNKSEFLGNIRKAVQYGLPESAALQALTDTPARMLGVYEMIGSLESGKVANFIVTSGNLFEENTKIHENWVQGNRFVLSELPDEDQSGQYTVSVDDQLYHFEVSGKPGSYKVKNVINDSTTLDVKANFDHARVTWSFKTSKKDKDDIRLSGWTTDQGWKGTGQKADGSWTTWEARKNDTQEGDGRKESGNRPGQKEDLNLGEVIYPFIAYGKTTLPTQKTLLIQNATVWTNEEEGVLQNADVLIRDGKIAGIGRRLQVPDAEIIDGSGKHLTPGIIDEHTHIAGGGNDGAVNSSMVRIGDQVNSEQVNIYRSLAGGVTAAQVLHGSANPIGGQSALIKLRWGESPEGLKIKDAPKFIKFALGENVKRSTNPESIRYPQSRMGVEQIYVDAFTNAREYEKQWKAYEALSVAQKKTAIKPRRDLVHDAMLEILKGERFITCHSYVQSEINMLMKVAEQFGFRVNTFTHILEGYKVADKMREHGAAASSFSDWWNYKWEVRYAIPYNAAILHNEGVLTAINSDDANSGRRLNQEAAKSIKYGGMSEEDALKMVTLNPAKMLHLDDRMGSIKLGKDADVVLWTDHPLSIYAKAEKTIVDGKIYFDLVEDEDNRHALQEERARLIQKMKDAKKRGGRAQRGPSAVHFDFHCDDIYDSGLYLNHEKH